MLEETVHPHITRVYELLEDRFSYYIIMELVSGGNLFDMIKNESTFTESKAANCINQVCLAINYMHNLNIMHRDLKPENLMIESTKDGEIVIKLCDFGFATYYDPD